MDGYFLGTVLSFAGNYAPSGFTLCKGQVLPIHGNEALYSVIGTRFGGNGQTTFQLPNLTAPEGLVYIICTNGLYPERDD